MKEIILKPLDDLDKPCLMHHKEFFVKEDDSSGCNSDDGYGYMASEYYISNIRVNNDRDYKAKKLGKMAGLKFVVWYNK